MADDNDPNSAPNGAEDPGTDVERLIVPALPDTVKGYLDCYRLQRRPTLADRVHPLVIKLWPNVEFRKLLDAVDNENAVYGRTFLDEFEAAKMIQQLARQEGDEEVASAKLYDIMKALRVELRRYDQGRNQRKMRAIPEGAPADG